MADPDSRLRPKLTIDVVAPAGAGAAGLGRWLQSVAPARARGALTVAVVTDRRVQALNRRYRRNDRPTDVLSFPAFAPSALRRGRPAALSALRRGKPSERYLGDIVIAAGVARRQAREAGHPVATEVRILALHGLLHLLGYDHERDAGRMARAEARLRRLGGLREGLIERHR